MCVIVPCRSCIDAGEHYARHRPSTSIMAAVADLPKLERFTAHHSETSSNHSDVDMRSSDEGGEPVQGCDDALPASTLPSNAYCSLGCGGRIIGTKGSRPRNNGRAHVTCIDRAASRPPVDKKRKLRAPSPPPGPRKPSNRRQLAAQAMASLSAVVAELKNSDSSTALEFNSVSTSGFEQPTASTSESSPSSELQPSDSDPCPEPSVSDLLPHSKHSEPLKSKTLRANPKRMMKAYHFAILEPTDASLKMAEMIEAMDLSSRDPDRSYRIRAL